MATVDFVSIVDVYLSPRVECLNPALGHQVQRVLYIQINGQCRSATKD